MQVTAKQLGLWLDGLVLRDRVSIIITTLPSLKLQAISDFDSKVMHLNKNSGARCFIIRRAWSMRIWHLPTSLSSWMAKWAANSSLLPFHSQDWDLCNSGLDCIDGSLHDFFSGCNSDILTCNGTTLNIDYFDVTAHLMAWIEWWVLGWASGPQAIRFRCFEEANRGHQHDLSGISIRRTIVRDGRIPESPDPFSQRCANAWSKFLNFIGRCNDHQISLFFFVSSTHDLQIISCLCVQTWILLEWKDLFLVMAFHFSTRWSRGTLWSSCVICLSAMTMLLW